MIKDCIGLLELDLPKPIRKLKKILAVNTIHTTLTNL